MGVPDGGPSGVFGDICRKLFAGNQNAVQILEDRVRVANRGIPDEAKEGPAGIPPAGDVDVHKFAEFGADTPYRRPLGIRREVRNVKRGCFLICSSREEGMKQTRRGCVSRSRENEFHQRIIFSSFSRSLLARVDLINSQVLGSNIFISTVNPSEELQVEFNRTKIAIKISNYRKNCFFTGTLTFFTAGVNSPYYSKFLQGHLQRRSWNSQIFKQLISPVKRKTGSKTLNINQGQKRQILKCGNQSRSRQQTVKQSMLSPHD
ncbi:hypothetical protein LXL04_000088 [Taraxacum kok-saghyz]